MSGCITLTPAYGRDYRSAADAKADFDAQKDFVVADMLSPWCGRYATKAELSKDYVEVRIRYAKLTKVTIVKLKVAA